MIRKKTRIIAPTLITLVWVGLSPSLWAEIRLPAVIGDDMVIQQKKPVSIWGWAEPGEEVYIRLSGQEMKARAGGDGGWREVLGLGEFPFLYVQLAPYDYPYNPESTGGDVPDFLRLPLIWEAQTSVLQLPNTGAVVYSRYLSSTTKPYEPQK